MRSTRALAARSPSPRSGQALALLAGLATLGCASATREAPPTEDARTRGAEVSSGDDAPVDDAPEVVEAPTGNDDVPTGDTEPQGDAPVPHGSLRRSDIRAVMGTAASAMRRCYEETVLRGPEPHAEGRVMTSFVVGPDGGVQASQIDPARTEIESAALHQCMLEVVDGLRFPSPGGGGVVGVNYPWVFSVSDFSTEVAEVRVTPDTPRLLSRVEGQLRVFGASFTSCLTPSPGHPAVRTGLEIRVRFELTATGAARRVEVVDPALEVAHAVSCVRELVATRRFDPEPQPVRVELRLRVR
ncbi:MAG: AgmX/PglI C-terminal domain-containing protein [Sandaracinaceae bacterium]|nr:AgmX/PglI C-terminal domain-containing protein [Sandaracinaceae bacterium]